MVTSSTQPALGAIRLAWWREALERLDASPPPGEPRLRDAATRLLPLGIRGGQLAELEAGWATLLEEEPDIALAEARGAHLFGIAAAVLKASDPCLDEAGMLFARGQLVRAHVQVGGQAAVPASLRGRRFPRALRPLTGLSRLAARDLAFNGEIEPEATPGRALQLLRHRLSGRVC